MIIVFVVIGLIVALAWTGLQVTPTSFPKFTTANAPLATVDLPSGLPAPVQRFYQMVYGPRVPLIRSAVLSGRAHMQLFGLRFPARFRFVHDAGKAYRHYFEVTWFGLPIFKVNEHFIDGHAQLELPVGVQRGANIDQAANLALWAEASAFPALFITDPRVQWQAVDDETAVLIAPFGAQQQHLIARFDPETGLLRQLEAMRYRDATDTNKTLWIAESRDWNTVAGHKLARVGAAIWFDQGHPWATFTTEEVVLNADVSQYVRASGL
jgi:hypothetical protein